jgi:AbrB family looped-hinge helix DNA binding protein
MTEHSRIGPNGEVIIPSELRERLNWTPGMEIEFGASSGGVVVRPKAKPREGISVEEFVSRRPKYEGPILTLEEMERGIGPGRAERRVRKERNSR